jgi:hypothetical protein
MRRALLSTTVALMLGVSLAGGDAGAQTGSCPIAGQYYVSGMPTGGSRGYSGEAVITDSGHDCAIRWLPPNTSEGAGSLVNGIFTAHFLLGGERGVVRYERKNNGDLSGPYWDESNPSAIQGQETLRPFSRQQTVGSPALARQIDSLIATDSLGWYANVYDRGSVRDVTVIERMLDSSNYVARANYTYNNGKPGWVKVRFINETFGCIEFFDSGGYCNALRRPLPRGQSQAPASPGYQNPFGSPCPFGQSDQGFGKCS